MNDTEVVRVSDLLHNPNASGSSGDAPAAGSDAAAGSGATAGTGADAAAALPRYDFHHPHHAAAAAALETLHATFATNLSAALSEQLRTPVTVALSYSEPLRYDEFIHSLGETSCISVLRVEPPGAECCLDLSLTIVYPMIDRLLGGAPGASEALLSRPLTQIEQGLILPVLERAAAVLGQTWEATAPLAVREEATESSPAQLRLMPEDEVVTALRFELALGSSAGRMSLCLPAPVTAYLCDPLAARPMPSRAQRQSQRDELTRNLLEAAVELRVLLAETKLRLSDVLTLQEGDVITTNRAAAAAGDLPMEVEGREKFLGQLGQLDGNLAVAVTQLPGLVGAAENKTGSAP